MLKRIIVFVLCLITFGTNIILSVNAIVPYESYTYNYWREKKNTPPAFIPSRLITSDTLNTTPLNNPSELFISEKGEIALADTDNNRVLIFNSDFKLVKEITEIEYQGQKSSIKNPEGIFIDKDSEMYLCDTGNNRIIRFTADGNVKQIYVRPESALLDGYSVYSPIRVVVDKSKKLYVICKGINMGILEIDESGILDKFIGAPLVYISPIEYFWKSIASKAQLSRMASYVPTEYNNLFLDYNNFLYVTTASVSEDQIMAKILSRDISTNSAPVKRLTLRGEDVLERGGFYPPVGDLRFPVKNQDYEENKDNTKSYLKESEKGPSSLVDICASDYGIYSVLDARRGRIFSYDYEGNLLFVFGGLGGQMGTFISPVSLCELNYKYYVLDKVTGSITEFVRTEYGTDVLNAVSSYNDSNYDKSLEQWQQVIKRDSNSEIAYLGLGKIYLMRNDWNNAMKYFKLSNSRNYYSKALKIYKNNVVGKYIGITVFVLIILAAVLTLFFKIKKGIRKIRNFGKTEMIGSGD